MSLTAIFRALLSAFTLFGGHSLNRRVDRLVLIGTLLALAAMISIGAAAALVAILGPDRGMAKWPVSLPFILIFAICVFSAWLTFLDARQQRGPSTTILKLTQLPLGLFGALVVAALLALAWISTSGPSDPSAFAPRTADRIEFGNSAEQPVTFDSRPTLLPTPPRGEERLRGRITLDGTGISGAKVALTLNSKYQIALDSDSRGEFEARLPRGEWHINDIVVNSWRNRPLNRQLLLFSNHEPLKRGGQYSRDNYLLADGLPVSLPMVANARAIELEFRDAIQITWPPYTPEPHDADFSTAAITWLPIAGASEYEVHISHIEYPESVTSDSPILTRHLSGLTLPLATLPQRTPTEVEDDYGVHIFAFDADGRLLTESNSKPMRHIFTLSGTTRLGKEQQYVGFDGAPKVISAEYELNQTRLQIARHLLDQNRFDEGQRMLDQVTKDAPCGGASALRGRLAALQGDCATASKLFDKTEAEGGCVPDEDRKLCEAAMAV